VSNYQFEQNLIFQRIHFGMTYPKYPDFFFLYPVGNTIMMFFKRPEASIIIYFVFVWRMRFGLRREFTSKSYYIIPTFICTTKRVDFYIFIDRSDLLASLLIPDDLSTSLTMSSFPFPGLLA